MTLNLKWYVDDSGFATSSKYLNEFGLEEFQFTNDPQNYISTDEPLTSTPIPESEKVSFTYGFISGDHRPHYDPHSRALRDHAFRHSTVSTQEEIATAYQATVERIQGNPLPSLEFAHQATFGRLQGNPLANLSSEVRGIASLRNLLPVNFQIKEQRAYSRITGIKLIEKFLDHPIFKLEKVQIKITLPKLSNAQSFLVTELYDELFAFNNSNPDFQIVVKSEEEGCDIWDHLSLDMSEYD